MSCIDHQCNRCPSGNYFREYSVKYLASEDTTETPPFSNNVSLTNSELMSVCIICNSKCHQDAFFIMVKKRNLTKVFMYLQMLTLNILDQGSQTQFHQHCG